MSNLKMLSQVIALGASAFLAASANANGCIDQVPVLNGNNGSVISSGSYSSQYQAHQAFDGVRSTGWISEVWETPAYIGYAFNQPTYVDTYTIDYTNGSITTRAPKDFQLQGSNGAGWITLDTRTGETSWSGSEKRSYSVQNPGHYEQYRVFITEDNDDRDGIVTISMGELTLESCSCNYSSELVPVLSGNTANVFSSGSYSSAYPAWKAFDNSTGSMWISEVYETPATIGYSWAEPRFVDQYAIQFANGSLTSRAPKDFELQGFDGTNWVTVDERTGQTAWGGSEVRHYTVTSPGSYQDYRLVVEDDNDSRAGVVVVSMGNLSLRGCKI